MRKEDWKIKDFNRVWTSVTLWYRCSALTNWTGHLWVQMFLWWMNQQTQWYMKWIIYWTGDMKSSTAMILAVMNPIFSNCLKNSGLQYNYDSFHISFCFLILSSPEHLNHKWPIPNVSGFIAQLVRASPCYHKVTGWNLLEVLNFSGFSTQLLKNVHNCKDHGFTWFHIRRSIYDSFHIYNFVCYFYNVCCGLPTLFVQWESKGLFLQDLLAFVYCLQR